MAHERLARADCQVGVALVLAFACAACGRASSENDDSTRPAPEDQRAIADFRARLARARAAAARAAEEQPCPESPPGKEIFGATLLADDEVLSQIERTGVPTATSPTNPWHALTSPALFELRLGAAKTADAARDTHYRIVQLEQRYSHLAVVRAAERVAPELHADRFVTGKLDAWLSVFDLKSAAIICSTHFTATNSDQVAGSTSQSRADAIRRDFTVNVRHELDRAAQRLSPALLLEHD